MKDFDPKNVDASNWASHFCYVARAEKATIDEQYMVGWFANYATNVAADAQADLDRLSQEVGRLKAKLPQPKNQTLKPKNGAMG